MTDWAYRLGVEDRTFGKPAGNPSAPITPDTRERYMAGYNSEDARIAANRAMVERAADKARKSQAAWVARIEGVPVPRKKRGKHEHGKDW